MSINLDAFLTYLEDVFFQGFLSWLKTLSWYFQQIS